MSESAKQSAEPLEARPLRLLGSGSFTLRVARAGDHQAALEEIAGPRSHRAKDHRCEAALVREPENPVDPCAVRVEIDGKPVGYLPNNKYAGHVADEFVRAFPSALRASCAAKVVGGFIRDARKNRAEELGPFGVRLDLVLPPRVADEVEE